MSWRERLLGNDRLEKPYEGQHIVRAIPVIFEPVFKAVTLAVNAPDAIRYGVMRNGSGAHSAALLSTFTSSLPRRSSFVRHFSGDGIKSRTERWPWYGSLHDLFGFFRVDGLGP